MASAENVRRVHEIFLEYLGEDDTDTLLDYLDTPRDWRTLIPGHPETRPDTPQELRLRHLYVALVEWMGGEHTDLFLRLLGIHGEWRLCRPVRR
jgi:hypothetical protein